MEKGNRNKLKAARGNVCDAGMEIGFSSAAEAGENSSGFTVRAFDRKDYPVTF